MSEQQWREVTFGDLREMTPDEQRSCRVRIGDVSRGVYALDNDGTIWTQRKGFTRDWFEDELSHWGAVYEAPVPPSRPIPAHEGAVIRLGDETVFQFSQGEWFSVGSHYAFAPGKAQSLADEYGWVELVPADGPDAEDARSAAIREVEADFRAQELIKTAARVRDRFPEAFSGAVNTKETDDD